MLSRSGFSFAVYLAAVRSFAAAGPCDIYADGNTPCVAAHSTTRALYSSFSGALYQISRGSDGSTTDINVQSAGGVADAASQDAFCANTTCLITIIYDQSGRGNHLTQAPPGSAAAGPQPGGYDNLASAIGAPVTVNGQNAYGVFISPGTGYRNNQPNGVATSDGAEGLYAIFDGTHYNNLCCFDYGNAETSSTDTGNGHMEAIYFGTNSDSGTGAGSGPWIMVDMENGLFSGSDPHNNQGDPSISYRFLTAAVKGGPNEWAIKGGNAQSGELSTFYNGARPNAAGYNPMSKEGALLLGTGGDNSDGSQGSFFEGVVTSGYPSDDTENAVQADIVSAKYDVGSLTSGPTLSVGSPITIRVTTPNLTTRFLAHSGSAVNTQEVSSYSDSELQQSAIWTVRTGLGNSACFSFESVDTPGSFIRHYNSALLLNANDGSKLFSEDATYCPQTSLTGSGTHSIRSWSYPTRYVRHYNAMGYIASNGGPEGFDATYSFNDDVSWVIGNGFA